MSDIAVVGDRDSIYGFASVGLKIYPADSPDEALAILRRIDDDCSVIFLTERLAEALAKDLERYRERTSPAVIPIPGVTGNTGYGMRALSRSVEQAVGSDILSD